MSEKADRRISRLPDGPEGRTGFPWSGPVHSYDEESLAKRTDLPKISVVTPSFNQGHFLEETIRSVLLQDYPNSEYIIVDGGSRDDTLSIIAKYEPWLHYWVSEPDSGQSHAINKGFAVASGDILAYLNCDDVYLPGAFYRIASAFLRSPQADFVYGLSLPVNANGDRIPSIFGQRHYWRWRLLYLHNFISQPATFWRRSAWEDIGQFDKNLHLVMDYDYWIRAALAHKVLISIPDHLVRFRYHECSKTALVGKLNQRSELQSIYTKYQIYYSTHLLYEVCLGPISQKAAQMKYVFRHEGVSGLFRNVASSTYSKLRKWLLLLQDASRPKKREPK